ncbi:hypothetical protein JL100_032730 (plasmid) [Skermanella mucosa]|uniref:hypothetical protein n=1 Tax=Skermanella mucosa TaxID=1789672 RepID=UPI00192CAE23|nr:hypothetical protein [Skermanella mucosa]UEM24391.1 hypothetical protein JL100_032730 [Skermanella mucosa]
MTVVPPEWLAEQQNKIRQAIKDLEEHSLTISGDEQEKVKQTIQKLAETLHGYEKAAGKLT